MEDLDVKTLIWRMFMIVTQQATVHLGNDFLESLHSTKNQPQRTVKQLFEVTRKLVKDQNEIQGISMINWQENSWNRTTLLTDRAVRLSTAKAYVFSDSALCMGRISENPVKAWKEKIDWFMNSSVVESWIESTGSRWSSRGKISQDSQHCRFSQRSRTWWLKYNVNLSNSQDGSPSCQWREKGNEEWCIVNSQIVAECARKFAHGHWSFLGPRSEKEWYGTHTLTQWKMGSCRWGHDAQFQ